MTRDLTVGNPGTVLWRFCLPLFGSVIFQQMYNIADSLIAGKFIGETALAAVGNAYEVTLLFLSVSFGCNIGCSVITAQKFGARQYGEMKTAVYTSLIGSGVLCVLLMSVGFLGLDWMLKLIQTPGDVFANCKDYLQIYILSLPFVFGYNVATGIFSALGDSQTPFWFLAGSSLANIGMDVLFVAVFSLGVPGVAWATLICQGVSCVFAMVVVFGKLRRIRTEGAVQMFSGKHLRQIAIVAIPSMLQQSFISVGNIVIQGIINPYGSGVMAGYSAAVKLNNLVTTSFTTIGNGMSNYTAQNSGAANPGRVRQGYWAGLKMVWLLSIPLSVLYFVFGEGLVGLFLDSDAAEAVGTGVAFLHAVAPFYMIAATKFVSDGVLRGAGIMGRFMISTFSALLLRVLLAYIFSALYGSNGIWLAWPIGWGLGTVLSGTFVLTVLYKRAAVNEQPISICRTDYMGRE